MVTCVVRASLYFFFLYFCICNCCAWLSDMAWPSLVTSDAQGSLYFSPGKIRCHYFTTSAFSSWSNTNTNTQHQKYKIAKTNTHIWCHYLTIHNSCDPGKLPNLVPKGICFALNLVFVLCTICMLVIEYLFSSFCKFCTKCQITRARCFSGHPPPPWPNFSNIHRKTYCTNMGVLWTINLKYSASTLMVCCIMHYVTMRSAWCTLYGSHFRYCMW